MNACTCGTDPGMLHAPWCPLTSPLDARGLIVQTFKVAATLCCIGYGMTGWVQW